MDNEDSNKLISVSVKRTAEGTASSTIFRFLITYKSILRGLNKFSFSSNCFTREITFVSYCLLSCKPSSLCRGAYSKKKCF